MNIEYKVKDLIKKYNTSNIKELVDHLDISIEYQDFKAKTLDSRLMIVDSKGYIFVRSDLDCAYENFLIAHELGHYVLHHDENISFNFLRRVYKTRLEREANEFAIRLLMYKELHNIKELENIEFIVKEKGIPLKVWYSLNEKILGG
ncbi:ImmA/IrrE family metallo-endopeptidase [Faecalibacillus intestinalis]|jgi:Zn-dependent peptidase ImmA (M78 family)|uniref:ImmA/IrrE family metallo-endopeptidase n=1 Tax=Faecalibacillus intestinalis TaxID=1982626 RepID=UPI0022E34416|nr:ImmA/IrrE family metallo-endopeptidase [Faecalibacillus intestinalis]